MILPGEETKQLILEVALKQFASVGYTAASIRSICREVGIKESSVYYHFKSKQEILDCLVAEFEIMAGRMTDMLTTSFQAADLGRIEDETFLYIGKRYYIDFLNNERIYQLISMLLIEQRSDPSLGKLYAQLMFEQPLATQTRFFDLLTACGYLKALPARDLAVMYQSIFHFCFSRQLALGSSAQQAALELDHYLSFFLDQFKGDRT